MIDYNTKTAGIDTGKKRLALGFWPRGERSSGPLGHLLPANGGAKGTPAAICDWLNNLRSLPSPPPLAGRRCPVRGG
jgi:hypothetical protein